MTQCDWTDIMKLTGRGQIPKLAVGCLLLWALLPFNPYGYYVLLRWIVSGLLAYLVVSEYRAGRIEWAWIYGVCTGVYNPIIPVHLGRSVWFCTNIATIVMVVVSVVTTIRRGPQR